MFRNTYFADTMRTKGIWLKAPSYLSKGFGLIGEMQLSR